MPISDSPTFICQTTFHRRTRPVWVSGRMDEIFYGAALVKPFG